MPFHSLTEDLASRHWSLQRQLLPPELLQALMDECRHRDTQGLLRPARIGRATGQALHQEIRGDRIHWLEPGQSESTDTYLSLMDRLRQHLNQSFFLGLESFECHFALYPPGSFYQTHLDRFRDDDSRTVTAVLYLNADWQPEHGGLMRLYLADGSAQDIPPLLGHLAVFMSADMPHEVLPTHRERMALTGWFRRRTAEDRVL